MTNDNIRQLLEMLDNPDAYTEQEIQDIINRDEDTRETYRLMVEAKRSSRHRQSHTPEDTDAAWQRFSNQLQPKQQGIGWMKIAASFIGVLLISGIAFAAIHLVRSVTGDVKSPTQETQISNSHQQETAAGTIAKDTVTVRPVVYDNIPLEKMLPEIAAHYDVKVTFANDEARGLRFRFVWNPQQGIEQVVSDLNQFERLTVTLKEKLITVDVLMNVSEKK